MEYPPQNSAAIPPLPATKSSGLALTAMILGIVSLIGGFFLMFPPILAVVLGHISVAQCKKDPSLTGRGMGIAGFVMGYVALIPMLFVMVGLFAAMSIPAFQKVRTEAQQKAMLNQARMLSAAADQYFLESGATTASLAQIVGPEKYVKALMTVDGEKYPANFTINQEIVVRKKDGSALRYAP